jgi:hypothetical protein
MDLQSSKGTDSIRQSPARAFDYLLCGEGCCEADHGAAGETRAVTLETRDLAWENRRFLTEAVRYMAGKGIWQFLDIGSGLTVAGDVHQVARSAAPGARVVHVDDDPAIHPHARKLMGGDERTVFVEADVRQPKEILDHPETVRLLDFNEPVGVLMVSVMHFVGDEDDPYGLVERIMDAMRPGSYLGLAHVTSDDIDPAVRRRIDQVYGEAPTSLVLRTRDEIARFFTQLRLLSPGLVDVGAWSADGGTEFKPGPMRLLGAVAVKT